MNAVAMTFSGAPFAMGELGQPVFVLDALFARAAALTGIDEAQLRGRARTKDVVRARAAIILVMMRRGRVSYPWLGRRMGRDHSTIIHGHRMAEELVARSPDYRGFVAALAESAAWMDKPRAVAGPESLYGLDVVRAAARAGRFPLALMRAPLAGLDRTGRLMFDPRRELVRAMVLVMRARHPELSAAQIARTAGQNQKNVERWLTAGVCRQDLTDWVGFIERELEGGA